MAGVEVEAEIRIPQPRRQKLLICCVKNTRTASSQCKDCSCEAHTQKDKIIKRILQFFATPVSPLSISSALGQLPYKNAPLMPCPTCHLWPCHARRAIALCLGQSRLLLNEESSLSKVRSFCKKLNVFLQRDKNAGEEK